MNTIDSDSNPTERQSSRRGFFQQLLPVGLASMTIPSLLTGCADPKADRALEEILEELRKEQEELNAKYPEVHLGSAGADRVFIKYVGDEKMILMVDGYNATAIAEHQPDAPIANQEHTFSVDYLGTVSGERTYILTVDNQKYVYVDGYESGALTPLSDNRTVLQE